MLGLIMANKNGCDIRSSPSDFFTCTINDAEVDTILHAFLLPLIEALPAGESEIVRRAEILGESPEAISQALGLSRRVIGARLRSGRESLRQLIIDSLKS